MDLTGDPTGGDVREPVCKRMGPSVISFARRSKSRRIEILTNADPADHFLRALGPELYKMFYGTAYNSIVGRLHEGLRFPGLSQGGKIHLSRGGSSVDEHFRKSLGTKTWMEFQGF